MSILDIAYAAREIAQVPSRIASIMSLATDTNNCEFRSIQYAVKKYSSIKPRKSTVEVTPTGAWQYSLVGIVPTWKKSTHRITSIIYPYNSDYNNFMNIGYYDQNKIDDQDWTTILNPADTNKPYLRFLNYRPEASSVDKIWLMYDAPHVVTSDEDSITDEEDGDVEAFAYLVASRILFVAANYFARLDDSTVDIATVDNQLKSNTYNQRSRDAEKIFMDYMENNVEHSGRIDWDFYSYDSQDRFWVESRLT